ncbi:EAL domain-containing protein [Pseudomonas putida]|uniref:EAL domain-containing protein n=1 Tax=Pseudomonas putida TaxID=303 RepID=UPI00300EDBF7
MKWQSTSEARKTGAARVLVVGSGCADISVVPQSGTALNWYIPTVVPTVEAAVNALHENHFDAIASHISAHHADGLALPSLILDLYRRGQLCKVPALLWCTQFTSTVLEAHARLARQSGVPVKIVPSLSACAAHDFVHLVMHDEERNTPPPAQDNPIPSTQDLARALRSDNEMRVVLQPQVDLESGRIVGAEALARWRHPELGEIPPSIFVPLANEAGLNLQLFHYVGAQVITLLSQLKRAEVAIPIAVNASADTLCSANVAVDLERQLEQAGVQSSLVKIELTEDVAVKDMLSLSTTISWLRLRGFQVSIDDFGCGAATLDMLAKLPFSELKIDGNFVRGMNHSPSCKAAVDTTLSLAQALNLNIIAEGVETTEISDSLRQLGYSTGQGYGLFPPLEINDFFQALPAHRARKSTNYRTI